MKLHPTFSSCSHVYNSIAVHVWDALSMKTFKVRLNKALGDLIYLWYFAGELD